MACSGYLITLVGDKILLLGANYAPKGYEKGAGMSPGGRLDKDDSDILSTAVREWEEEVGIGFPVSQDRVQLLGIFAQEDLSLCVVFFVELEYLNFEKETDAESEIMSRKLHSFEEIKNLFLEKRIFRAQFQFISWLSLYRAGVISLPVYSMVNPAKPPEFIV